MALLIITAKTSSPFVVFLLVSPEYLYPELLFVLLLAFLFVRPSRC